VKNNPYLNLVSLEKSYGKCKVLNKLNLKLDSKQISAILGPSGSGKSTLLRCLAGLEELDGGNISFAPERENSQDSSKLQQAGSSGIVGIVFQGFNLFNNLTVFENLIIAGESAQLTPANCHRKAEDLLHEFNIFNLAESLPSKLSGGQKQRVAIARALMQNPKLLLLDEPTSALDLENIRDLLKTILKLKGNNIKILIVSHDINFVKVVADEIIFMDHGMVEEKISNADFFSGNTNNKRILSFLENIAIK